MTEFKGRHATMFNQINEDMEAYAFDIGGDQNLEDAVNGWHLFLFVQVSVIKNHVVMIIIMVFVKVLRS